jgi:hypothetical protein
MLDRTDAHRPIGRKRVTRALRLKSERIDRVAHRVKPALGIKRNEVDDAFAGTTRDRGAADVIDAQFAEIA